MNIFFSLLYRFKITRFQKHEFLQDHTISKSRIFFKITRFQNHAISKSHYFKITLFSKSRDFKITLFQKSRYFKNHAIFLGFLIIFKTSVFLKKFPFKVHFGIPRLKTCKKAVFRTRSRFSTMKYDPNT